MSLLISNVFTYDEDAGNYIQAVETADAQALEPATRKAINNFVIGCKQAASLLVRGLWMERWCRWRGQRHPTLVRLFLVTTTGSWGCKVMQVNG
jgi:hypothetical protein